jgi:hypothetical protein
MIYIFDDYLIDEETIIDYYWFDIYFNIDDYYLRKYF